MLKRFLQKQLQSIEQAGAQPIEIPPAMRRMRTTDDALRLIENELQPGPAGLQAQALEHLQRLCGAMRAQGLGLEPNLLSRAACHRVLDRQAAGEAAVALAADDGDFDTLTRRGDAARDRGAFAEAQYAYWQALQLYPVHPGYLVQYAHCLKEQALDADALLNYLDAHLHGAPRQDVEEHALFVAGRLDAAHRIGQWFEPLEAADLAASPLNGRPSSRDVVALCRLMLGRAPEIPEVAALMCRHATRAELLSGLIAHADFARTHRLCLAYLAESGWGKAA